MSRFRDIPIIVNNKSKRYYVNTILPENPPDPNDIYVITVEGDRLDNLSYEFYNNTQYWWVIAAANPGKIRKDSYYVTPGIQIRIPVDPSLYTSRFRDFNSNGR